MKKEMEPIMSVILLLLTSPFSTIVHCLMLIMLFAMAESIRVICWTGLFTKKKIIIKSTTSPLKFDRNALKVRPVVAWLAY